jgi:hypothetical protein
VLTRTFEVQRTTEGTRVVWWAVEIHDGKEVAFERCRSRLTAEALVARWRAHYRDQDRRAGR